MDIRDLRKDINDIDKQLIELFKRRMETSCNIAEYKSRNNLPILDENRENEVLERVADMAGEPFSGYAKVLYSTLFDLSRSYQTRIVYSDSKLSKDIEKSIISTPEKFPRKARVACQGVEGAYSQIACNKLFENAEINFVSTFDDVFNEVEKGNCRYGILPIENSSAGSVISVYNLMEKHRFSIVKSVKLKIDHCLLVPFGVKFEDIKEIVSHEQAIGQCNDFLEQNKSINVTVFSNTAAAAKYVAESRRKDIAAISSKNCAEIYNLKILEQKVQNNENNCTRFICISKDMEIYPDSKKISLMMTIPHSPGSLYHIMSKFAALDLNLTKLESRPISGKNFEFLFYFDFDASVFSKEVKSLLNELDAVLEYFVFLGNYNEID